MLTLYYYIFYYRGWPTKVPERRFLSERVIFCCNCFFLYIFFYFAPSVEYYVIVIQGVHSIFFSLTHACLLIETFKRKYLHAYGVGT